MSDKKESVIRVSADTHKRLKILAANRELTIGELIEKLLDNECD